MDIYLEVPSLAIEKIINENDIEKQYSLVIDYVCDYLDTEMKMHNYCDFQDGRCIANRLKKSVHETNGCCYQYKVGLCKNLIDGACSTKNVSCKLFMCEYLEAKVIKFKLNKILPVNLIFNKKQIRILEKTYFKPKEEVIKLLIASSNR